MKATLLIVLATILCIVASSASQLNKQEFDSWKSQFGKVYSSVHHELKAFEIYTQNAALVNGVNSNPSSTWKAELNQFADMTAVEFKKDILGARFNPADLPQTNDPNLKISKETPASFDWRFDSNKPVVTSVKDQGSIGSCWAFSTIGNIEGQWSLAGNELVDLSPEFLVDCDGTSDATHADCSMFGGWPYLAYQFLIKAGGVPSNEAWPYCSGAGKCYPCMLGPVSLCGPPPLYCDESVAAKCNSFTPAAKISSWSAVSTNETAIASTLFAQGPLSVLLDASELQFYKSGIWDGEIKGTSPLMGCHSEELNHAVLMVGYGSESSQDYWSIKNSWGAKWGENGYFRITRGQGKCGINTAVTTSFV